ncbi:hypothetical protein E2C01_013172 [Portunus trituberculatus]|uniref:Uncharacterized protein n=1 Tax=Portunus trituberculatus TaxID=210409 RepID=A0A5B7DFX7_PORTR|nr:hypothetical protein [Portunus trituberculatus]
MIPGHSAFRNPNFPGLDGGMREVKGWRPLSCQPAKPSHVNGLVQRTYILTYHSGILVLAKHPGRVVGLGSVWRLAEGGGHAVLVGAWGGDL